MNIAGKLQRARVSEKIVRLNRKFFSTIFLISICFILDRVSKIYVIQLLINNDLKDYYVNQFINITLIWNKGIAFGLLQSESFTYNLISIFILIIILIIFFMIFKSSKFIEALFYSIIAGGALGNLFDRIYYNAVPDFIDLHYKNFHWFTFNISDILITLGIVSLIVSDIVSAKGNKNV